MPGNHTYHFSLQDVFTRSPVMQRCLRLAEHAARSDVPVLILGESGTGKTLLAQMIHNSSARAKGRFISFNASAMSDTLLESQLFGHERGAFTGAHKTVKGKFELADTGTLFFDEIADMSPLAQAKILRAVEYGEFERLGSERLLQSNARVISATNQSLRTLTSQGKFREDLYYRLAGLTLLMPSLRDRRDDLPGLIASELAAAAKGAGKDLTSIHPAAMDQLLAYSWPGNLRELHHTIRTVALFCDGTEVQPEHVLFQPDLFNARAEALEAGKPTATQPPHNAASEDHSLGSATRAHVRAVFEKAGRNQRQTARLLKISRACLARHLKAMNQK